MNSLTNGFFLSHNLCKYMYKLMSIVYFSQKQDKSDINKLNRQECKIIATTSSVPMAKRRKEMV